MPQTNRHKFMQVNRQGVSIKGISDIFARIPTMGGPILRVSAYFRPPFSLQDVEDQVRDYIEEKKSEH